MSYFQRFDRLWAPLLGGNWELEDSNWDQWGDRLARGIGWSDEYSQLCRLKT